MGTDLNFRSGNLQVGQALGNLPLNVTLAADNQVINPGVTPLVRITSDNATSTNRTFSLTAGSFQGQMIYLTLVGSSTNQAELLSTGNVSLSIGTWTATVGSTLCLMWDMVSSLWREQGRSTGGDSGRFTPAWTLGANAVSASALSSMYTRIGNIVTFSGQTAVVTTAAANTLTTIKASLPIASNFTVATDVAGAANRLSTTGTASSDCIISADFTLDLIQIDFNSAQTASALLTFTCQYEVK